LTYLLPLIFSPCHWWLLLIISLYINIDYWYWYWYH
jgi:hypothetical protein